MSAFNSVVATLRCCFDGVKNVSMLYFFIIEHLCALLPIKLLIPVSSSSTLKLASESLLIIEPYFAMALTSLNTLLFLPLDNTLTLF